MVFVSNVFDKQTMAEIKIRSARKEDLQEVFKLVKELAAFQKLEHQVEIDEKSFVEDALGETPAFYCIVAQTVEQEIVGYAIYFHGYSTFLGKSLFCEDIYVKPTMRHKGIGKKLMGEMAKVALAHCGRLDFHVLSWNPAIRFYEKLGATNLSETEKWLLFRLYKSDLVKLVKDVN